MMLEMYLLRHALTLAVAMPLLGAVPVQARTDPSAALPLQRDPGSVVSAAEIPLDTRLLPVEGTRTSRTAMLRTAGYKMVALTWQGTSAPMRLRTRSDGRWTRWQVAEPLADLADGEASLTRGSELLWAGRSDGVQVSVQGSTPRELELVLIDPGVLASDATPTATASATDTTRAPRPTLYSRADWGADEDWRNGGPWYNNTIKQVHVHHTATSNHYARADVAGIIRGMYRYHTHTLGWSDIGYNFLVDKFGRAWVGRAGGYALPVRGAHTLGFNHASVGIAMIGNYETAVPSTGAVTSLVRLAAWKLDRFDRRPAGWTKVYSHGSDLYPYGALVTLRVIDGHRDTNQTACPGDNLYRLLPRIRDRAQARVDYYGAVS